MPPSNFKFFNFQFFAEKNRFYTFSLAENEHFGSSKNSNFPKTEISVKFENFNFPKMEIPEFQFFVNKNS